MMVLISRFVAALFRWVKDFELDVPDSATICMRRILCRFFRI
jgi:hypothetical protein